MQSDGRENGEFASNVRDRVSYRERERTRPPRGVTPRFEARELARFIIVPRRDQVRDQSSRYPFRSWPTPEGEGRETTGIEIHPVVGLQPRVLLVLTVDPTMPASSGTDRALPRSRPSNPYER